MSEYYTRFQHNLMKYEISYKGGAGGWPVSTGVTSPAEPGERSVFLMKRLPRGWFKKQTRFGEVSRLGYYLSSSV